MLGESHDPRASSRQALLHDGDGGEQLVSAYVEITLDNTDERLPVDSNEVTIRRQVGAKKDEYFVNMKKSQQVRCAFPFSLSLPNSVAAIARVPAHSRAALGSRQTLELTPSLTPHLPPPLSIPRAERDHEPPGDSGVFQVHPLLPRGPGKDR